MSSDTASTEKKTKKKRYTSNIITLKPGEGHDAITIHEDILRDHSPFFKAALDKKWLDGATREIKLPDDTAEVVAAYVDWLYSRRLELDVPKDTKGRPEPESELVARLYCFGEKSKTTTSATQSSRYYSDRLRSSAHGPVYGVLWLRTPELPKAVRCVVAWWRSMRHG